MCSDYCSAWKTSVAEAHALVYDKSSNVSTSYENSSWKKNAPSTKAVMGMPAYSRTWQLKDANDHDIEAPAGGVGPIHILEPTGSDMTTTDQSKTKSGSPRHRVLVVFFLGHLDMMKIGPLPGQADFSSSSVLYFSQNIPSEVSKILKAPPFSLSCHSINPSN